MNLESRKRGAFGGRLAIAALVLALGCGRAPAGPYDVILVSIDTLRADRLGLYGYDRPTSPALDAFGASSAVFQNAIAESPWTLPSHVTMLSGLFPGSHAAVRPGLRPGDETPLLAEILSRAGYRTFGFTDGGYVDRSHGFDRGFDVFDDQGGGLAGSLARARAEISALSRTERYFLFLHTYDVHCPYVPDPAVARSFVRRIQRPIDMRGKCGNPNFNSMILTPPQLQYVSDHYDAGIRELDDTLGPFLTELEASGRLERTIVVITSDHGEELGEHGQIGHERSLHAELLRIPLLVRAPGVVPVRVETLVGLADVLPTILEWLRVEAPRAIDGESLVALVGGTSTGARGPRFSELDRHVTLRSVLTQTHHLITAPSRGRSKLYSTADRLEARDLAADEPEVARELTGRIRSYESAREARPVETVPRLGDAETERLRQLGYLDP